MNQPESFQKDSSGDEHAIKQGKRVGVCIWFAI